MEQSQHYTDDTVYSRFTEITRDLWETEEVQSMAQWKHHGEITCLQHSMSVAVSSYRIACKLGLDGSATARAGLLHDLYLYHKRDRSAHSGNQCFDHPKIAAKNAKKITELSEKEENIIRAHMWPFGGPMPKSPEAVLVNVVDTVCAVGEFLHLYRPEELFRKLELKTTE